MHLQDAARPRATRDERVRAATTASPLHRLRTRLRGAPVSLLACNTLNFVNESQCEQLQQLRRKVSATRINEQVPLC